MTVNSMVVLRVLLDTLVDVVGRVAAHVQAVVVFMGEPALGERGVEFFQPADHKDLLEQLVGQRMDDFAHHQGAVDAGEKPEGGCGSVLQGIVEAFVEK